MRGRVVVGVTLVVLAGVLWWLREEKDEASLPAASEVGEAPAQAVTVARVEAAVLQVDPRLGARASIAGFVKDPRGTPIAGAQVCALANSERVTTEERRRTDCVTSERDGHYRIAGLFPVRHEVVGSAPGYIPALHVQGEGASRREWVELRQGMELLGADIVLEEGGVEIRGVVKDLSGGPIEGAQLLGNRQPVVVTGPEGEFSMWVKPGSSRCGRWPMVTRTGATTAWRRGTSTRCS
ncbi:carboxypeptidase-like regulatory domain-containing protein [Nannocystis pusilla]|uniref:carboxypeptidase-like regulatory domain-containing protein n=1 Tax=Nannocystis pusilla TaxID=889268 RepID=UPI003DA63593